MRFLSGCRLPSSLPCWPWWRRCPLGTAAATSMRAMNRGRVRCTRLAVDGPPSEQAELLQDAEFVGRAPAVGRLAVPEAKHLHVPHRETLAGRRVPEELASVGAGEVHDRDEPGRGDDRLDHLAFDIAERLAELLPEPGRAARAGRLPRGRVVVGEVSVVPVLDRQRRIAHPRERVKSRLAAFGYLGRHWCPPIGAATHRHLLSTPPDTRGKAGGFHGREGPPASARLEVRTKLGRREPRWPCCKSRRGRRSRRTRGKSTAW